jgi:hypothetical protein
VRLPVVQRGDGWRLVLDVAVLVLAVWGLSAAIWHFIPGPVFK